MDLSMVVEASSTMVLYNYDNSRVVAQCKKKQETTREKNSQTESTSNQRIYGER